MNKSINQTFICSQEFSNTVMEATIVDFTQPLKPTSLAWENPLISVKLATMCLFSSMIFTRIISRTNHTTSRTIYNNWAQQHYQGYPPSAVNIWMFIHSIALQWQATITLLAPLDPIWTPLDPIWTPFGPPLFEKLTWDVVHRVVAPELVHRVVALGFVRAVHAHLDLQQVEDGVVVKIASLEAHWEWTRFDYHFDK